MDASPDCRPQQASAYVPWVISGALIGFAGPRVIEQTVKQTLPEGFQRAEFLLEHGMVDMVVDRRKMRGNIIRVLDFMMNPAMPG